MRRRHLLLIALPAVLLLSSCGTQKAGPDDDLPRSGGLLTPAALDAPAACPDDLDPLSLDSDYSTGPHLTDDLKPVGVLRCVFSTEDDPATGRWTVVRTEKAMSGIADYAAALRRPNAPEPTGDVVCTADALVLPWSAVILPDGSALKVALPVGACGKPLPEVMAALESLTFDTVSTRRIAKTASIEQLALEKEAERLGCSYQFKDMVTIEAGDGPDDGSRDLLATRPSTLVACRYTADPTSSDPVLTFAGGGRSLTATDTAAVVDALASATPTTASCNAPHTSVWGLYGPGNGPWLLVELDGCGRVASDTGPLRTLPKSSIAAVRAVLEQSAG